MLIESKPIVLEGQKGGMWIYEITGGRLDVKLIMRTLQYSIFYKNKLIMVQFSTGGTPETRKNWVAEFDKNRALFTMIANSLVLMDQYKTN
jgi:hypothetical protein